MATVGNDEITVRELSLELQNIPSSDPQAQKALERQALDVIINRKAFANAARKQGIDNSPEFQLARQRAEETLLAQALQRQLLAKVARPTREEAEKYVGSHPHSYAERKIFIVDQVQFPRDAKPEVLKAVGSMKTLQDIEQYFLANGIDHRRVPGSFDTRGAPTQLVEQITRLPASGIFVLPSAQMFVANQIRETRVVPFTGEEAIKQAQQILMNERVNGEVKKQVEQIRAAAGAVKYKPGYGPPQAAAAQAPAAQAQQQKPAD